MLAHELAHEVESRWKSLQYFDAHIILICFSIGMVTSLDNAKHRWLPELLHFCSERSTPYILVGCMKDLRSDAGAIRRRSRVGQEFVTMGKGEVTAREIGARRYCECSSKTGEGVKELFDLATRMSMETPTCQEHRSDGCLVL